MCVNSLPKTATRQRRGCELNPAPESSMLTTQLPSHPVNVWLYLFDVAGDQTSSRMTLKMEIAHTEHSHVIGKGGNNIKRVMHDTGCHIHFPDSNRSAAAEKSNQV